MFFTAEPVNEKIAKKNQRVLPIEKNTQNKFNQSSFKIVAVAPERKCRFCISFSRVSGYFMRVLYNIVFFLSDRLFLCFVWIVVVKKNYHSSAKIYNFWAMSIV